MSEYSTITFGGVTLYIESMSASKSFKTIKQKIGDDIARISILGMSDRQWILQISGIIYSNLSTGRAALEALDDSTAHAYVDGLHNGDYIISPNTLVFDDNSDSVNNLLRYSMTLIED